MLKTLCFVLLLGGAVLAQDSPREWVLTIDDLKSRLPAQYRVKRGGERFQHGDYVVSSYGVYSYTDLKQGIFMISQVNREISSWDARTSYLPMTLGAKYGFDDKRSADYSKVVAAGEQSHASLSDGGDTWMFTFRQRRAWGMLILSGFSLKPKEMDALVDRYVARLDSLQTRKKPKRKNSGIWRWP